MSDTPTLVKILRYLHSNAEPSTYGNIITTVQKEQELVDRALSELVSQGIIDNDNEYYSYKASPEAEEFCQKLFALYNIILRTPQMELLVCGLLSRAGGGHLLRMNTLLHVLAIEGFATDDVLHLLDQEMAGGFIKKIPVIFFGMDLSLPPVLIPACYESRLQINPAWYELAKEWCQTSGSSSIEEDYLIGEYPDDSAEAGIQYVETEKQRAVTEVLREEAVQQETGIDLIPWQDVIQSPQYQLGLSEISKGILDGGAYASKKLMVTKIIGIIKSAP
ncbi:hypothetical protein ACFLVZ_00735 [Chloroflexota bacterium]